MLNLLAKLSHIAMAPSGNVSEEDILRACDIVRDALGAEEAYLVRAGDPHFIKLGSTQHPTDYEIKQKGYWLAWKELAADPRIEVAGFQVRDRLAFDGFALAAGLPATHVVSSLPGDESNSELLVARGPWPGGLTEAQIQFLSAARPMLARLATCVLDTNRRDRQREQFRTLADLSAAFSQAETKEGVLASVATALAQTSGFDWVSIYVVDESLQIVIDHARNVMNRYSATDTALMSQAGEMSGQAKKHAAATIRQMAVDKAPVIYRDIFAPDSTIDMDDVAHAYFQRAHIISIGTFPIVFRGLVMGSVTFHSSRRHEFDEEETQFLANLVSRACVIVEGLRLHRELRTAEERLRTVAANAPIVLWSISPEGLFTLSEGRGLSNLGFAPGEVIGQSVFDLYADQPEVIAGISRALDGEENSWPSLIDGYWWESQVTPLRDEAGRVSGVIGVSIDVTQRRRNEDALRAMQHQLLQAQKLESIGQLAGGIAHDFNNLLTAILGFGQLVADQLEDGSPLADDMREVLNAAQRAATLTRQLLGFARRQIVLPREVDLNQSIQGMEQMLRRLIGEDVGLSSSYDEESLVALIDPGQFEQIIMNLAVNARDAMLHGGEITIQTRRVSLDETFAAAHEEVVAGEYALIEMTDNGTGMTADVIEHIFEPFFTTKEVGKGTGLGLATSYGIVKQAMGHITVRSEPGLGTTFSVYLPSHGDTGIRPPTMEVASELAGRLSGLGAVLLVEDQQSA